MGRLTEVSCGPVKAGEGHRASQIYDKSQLLIEIL